MTRRSNILVGPSEATVIFLMAATQFVNVLDFVMVMPMGPDFARALHMPLSHLGFIGAAYTFAGFFAGVAGVFFLDRFDRRSALVFALIGLSFATMLGGLARSPDSLLVARFFAGLFGGPATSLSLAIVSDQVESSRRGAAMGKVMGAFSIASIVGIPVSLEISRVWGWQFPFFVIATSILIVSVAVWMSLPPLRSHIHRREALKGVTLSQGEEIIALIRRPGVVGMSLIVFFNMLQTFSLVPHLSGFFQANRGLDRAMLGHVYFYGGIASFISLRLVGKGIDRVGPVRFIAVANTGLILCILLEFLHPTGLIDITLFYILFMILNSGRMVAVSSTATRVAPANERARMQSVYSAMQHLGSSLGAAGSSLLLTIDSSGAIQGIERLALISSMFAIIVTVGFVVWHKKFGQIAIF